MDGRGWNGAWGPGLVPPRPTPPPNPNLDAPPFVDGWPLPASTLNALFSFIGFRSGVEGLAPGPYLPIAGGPILGNLVVEGAMIVGGTTPGGFLESGSINASAYYHNGQKLAIDLTLPIDIQDGGTGATNAADALDNLGGMTHIIAGIGLTGDTITNGQTIGLAVPVSIAHGGTGTTTASAALTALGALPAAGGIMTGPLILSGMPSQPNQAASKAYIDALLGTGPSGGIADAPTDGRLYARMNGQWIPAIDDGVYDGTRQALTRTNGPSPPPVRSGNGVPEAPLDSQLYGRMNAQWVELIDDGAY